ncbi:MAG: trypsin-like serine protease [Proteobacteria bacterium]|nr:trypsin-like serine protease [Pseudomonadota bacterium]
MTVLSAVVKKEFISRKTWLDFLIYDIAIIKTTLTDRDVTAKGVVGTMNSQRDIYVFNAKRNPTDSSYFHYSMGQVSIIRSPLRNLFDMDLLAQTSQRHSNANISTYEARQRIENIFLTIQERPELLILKSHHATESPSGQVACSGDSGSPIIQNGKIVALITKGINKTVGISSQNSCYDVWIAVNIAPHMDWIKSTMSVPR